jgi:hypothetical protein
LGEKIKEREERSAGERKGEAPCVVGGA